MSDTQHYQKCPRCQQVKSESSFRYIKFFNKRRRICKRCENLERHTKRRSATRQKLAEIKEFGVTHRVQARLRKEATRQAKRLAQQLVFSEMSRFRVVAFKMLRTARIVSGWGGLFLLSCWWIFYAAKFREVQWVIAAAFALYGVCYLLTRSTERSLATNSAAYFKNVYDVLHKARIDYEQFYRSQEWRIVREHFLSTKRKVNGSYVCEICLEMVIDDVTVDHFQPRSKFPHLALEITNLRVAHRECNSSKGDRLIDKA